ncbi:MAG TPA: hypothetical protein VGM18_14135 [Candidatus Sulfotelmatobacter sp.]
MNPIANGYSKCFSVFLLSGAVLVSSHTPLLANPPQSSSPQSNQSTSTEQKQDNSLPDAPQAQPAQTPANSQSAQTPSGAAGAKAANVKGSPAAQPAGAAVAPPRQHGHRSLLIKLGLLAGGGIAVGSVVALSERNQARPPGASSATRP